jgi:hypothetical protein
MNHLWIVVALTYFVCLTAGGVAAAAASASPLDCPGMYWFVPSILLSNRLVLII